MIYFFLLFIDWFSLNMYMYAYINTTLVIIGINHGFQCSNMRWITRKVFEHKAAGRVFKHLPSDPAYV